MKRFFVDKITTPAMFLGGDELWHMSEVLRAKPGDEVVVCQGDGYDYIFRIKSLDKRSAFLEYVEKSLNNSETTVNLTVYFALLKGDKSEFVVTKLTELGVKKIVPFVSRYTVKSGEKTDRMKRAALEACKQCGRARLPEITDITGFSGICDGLSCYDKVVFAYEGAFSGGSRIKDVVSGKEKSIALIVGPEGGFSEDEVKMLTGAGYPAVTLGKRIMRAETASIAAAAVLLHLCGEWE